MSNVQDFPEFKELAPHIVKSFWKYHKANPEIWRHFKRYALEVKTSGRTKYGVQSIAERIRWHIQVETKGDDFKMNNNHLSCYARLLMIEHPVLGSLFRTRRSPGTGG